MTQEADTIHFLPAPFLERMKRLLGDEYAEFLASYLQPPAVGLRVNTLKISSQDYERLSPFDLTPVPWAEAGYLLHSSSATGELLEEDADKSPPGKHPHHAAGLYYLQDPSAMAVAETLAPQPGEIVLDLSAAPGGKATHIAALMKGEGVLVANEIRTKRVWGLVSNLERWGARNVSIVNENPARLVEHFGAFFDKVLVDAPCSGEGMFRKSKAARLEWSPELVESCPARQQAILQDAARLVRPGGTLVYSTCTFAPEEDEAVIARFLTARRPEEPGFEMVEIKEIPGAASGRADWLSDLKLDELSALHLERCARLWPQRAPGEGHFIAKLRRIDESTASNALIHGGPTSARHKGKTNRNRDPRKDLAIRQFQGFAAENFVRDKVETVFFEDRFALAGSYLYQLPQGMPDLSGLRVIHPGWWLGVTKKDRFEPAHALAMGLPLNSAFRAMNFKSEDDALIAYLKGEVLEMPDSASKSESGWTLVGVDGFSTGWGKLAQRRLKNYYPHGLRLL